MKKREGKSYRAIAEYYDFENQEHDMLRHDVPLLLGHLPRKSQTILELATGTARAAIPLAQAGHRVVGVDYAVDMLAIAKRKRDAVGISESRLSLMHADVLTLNLKKRFDWVVLLFNTFLAFTTLAQQDAVLGAVMRHLKPKGKFWLDIFQPNLELLARETSKNIDPRVFYVPGLNRSVIRTMSVDRDPAAQLQHIVFTYVWFDGRAVEHTEKVRFDLTFIFPRELQILLERNGLEIEKLYGDYDRSPLTADSPRMIALCHRKRGCDGVGQ